MGEVCELSYRELRAMEVIDVSCGRRLGRIVDIVFSAPKGDIKGIVVPFTRRWFFTRNQEVFIPWNCIEKIGEDVILVKTDGFNVPPHGRKDSRYGKYTDFKKDKGGGDYNHQKHDYAGDCDCDDDCHPRDTPSHKHYKENHHHHHKKDFPLDCDRKCEKCMMFDCAYRWKDFD